MKSRRAGRTVLNQGLKNVAGVSPCQVIHARCSQSADPGRCAWR
jgi:hypothetical protein